MKKEILTVSFAVLCTLPMQSNATGRMECEPIDVEAYFHPATGEKLLVARRGKILFRAEGVN